MTSDTERYLASMIRTRIQILKESGANDKTPDWFNPHDFRSGHWIGQNNARKDEIMSLKMLLTYLEG